MSRCEHVDRCTKTSAVKIFGKNHYAPSLVPLEMLDGRDNVRMHLGRNDVTPRRRYNDRPLKRQKKNIEKRVSLIVQRATIASARAPPGSTLPPARVSSAQKRSLTSFHHPPPFTWPPLSPRRALLLDRLSVCNCPPP